MHQKQYSMTTKRKNSLRIVSLLSVCAIICGLLLGLVPADSGPIKKETTKISYNHHTNSGMAIYTTVELHPDYLVWDYNEARNKCHLRDTCRYSKEDFDKLVNELSKIQFSAKDNHDYSVGGEGYSYSFEVNAESYLYFDNSYQFSGDYHAVQDLIRRFIKSHPTQCEILFKKFSEMPHERGNFGEFKELPRVLQKYKVKL